MYKVRWKGYDSGDDTWEPKENLDSCQDLIEEFDKKQSEITKKRNEERKMRQVTVKKTRLLEVKTHSNNYFLYIIYCQFVVRLDQTVVFSVRSPPA